MPIEAGRILETDFHENSFGYGLENGSARQSKGDTLYSVRCAEKGGEVAWLDQQNGRRSLTLENQFTTKAWRP